MLRLALVSALAALGACSNPDAAPTSAGAAVAESVAVTTLAQADVTPAAPPVSNAIPDAAPEAPRDTTDAQARTVQTFERIVADADSQRVAERPFGEVVQWVGEQLVGRPYVAGMLDAGPTETLVADLTAFDCVLYVENVIAIARVLALGTPTYDAYTAELRSLRYRDDDVQYCARLHYFSDWIRDNEARGAVENVTAAVGGEPFDKDRSRSWASTATPTPNSPTTRRTSASSTWNRSWRPSTFFTSPKTGSPRRTTSSARATSSRRRRASAGST